MTTPPSDPRGQAPPDDDFRERSVFEFLPRRSIARAVVLLALLVAIIAFQGSSGSITGKLARILSPSGASPTPAAPSYKERTP